jgi:hypothetical protein
MVPQGHLQNLMNQGFMTALELTASCVPEDPAFPAPVEGYVVTFLTFYEWEFDAPLHWFLCSLLQHYDLFNMDCN